MELIIWDYQAAFQLSHIEIAMFQQDERCLLVLQDTRPFFHAAPCDGMSEYMRINDWDCSPARSKVIEIDHSFFLAAYQTITESLVPMFKDSHCAVLDGDDLTIKVVSGRGHRCKIHLHAPGYNEEDPQKNSIYQLFLLVLEKAGLLDWYQAEL